MDEDVPQFDALLGGTEELPAAVTLANFVAYRSQEIQIMKNSLHSQSGTKLAFQTLPKHMRRRAMSHNVKRLPRRLRQIHLNQMKKSGMPAKQKRPSRKYRRRPRNLIEEYTKRSNKKYKWLQTHIWHAKRFHMVEKWGYKLPCHPCDKAFRACYRATTQHCLLQDISYINCIEISGNKNLIIETFKRLCRPNTGLTVGAKAFIDGNREGELTLFEMETSQKAIGTINFHWEPSHINEISKLWLWVHAAFYNDVLNNLIKCFQFNLSNLDKQKYYINESSGVKLTELAEELNRFRLTGPLANSVLHDTFVYNVCENVHTQQSWFKEYIESNNDNRLTVNNQYTYWKNISNITSVSEISPHIIISLIVTDPRLNFPKKRTKCVPTSERFTECEVPNNISRSPLWEKTIRNKVCESKIETSKIIELQSKLLVPGSDVKANNVFVPVLLIQRPGNKKENIGLGGGWDVILPSAWSKPFWIAMVMRGARVGGLRESRSILFEMGKSQFLQPDTDAGMKEEEQISKECVEKFFKKPPNKRINYNKFNI
ncbi:ribonucleases P/MRP protein subunit POP1, partial [Asbolus verrucosus]